MDFKYEFEERWFEKNNLEISSEFLDKLIKNNKKIIETNEKLLKFTFVGVLVYKKEVLIILPKYAKKLKDEDEKLDCIKTIIKVFKQIPNKVIKDNKDALFISNDINESEISEIAIADYIIRDFRENGYYIQNHIVKSINGKGRINWTNTINTLDPIISNKNPIYTNFITEDITINNNNFISNLHINLYNYLLAKYKVLLGYRGGCLSIDKAKNNLDKLGNKKYIISKIKKALESSFSDREMNLLKAMYNFFETNNDSKSNTLSIFGTSSFELVWEFICKYIFNDKYEEFKKEIPYPEWYTSENKVHKSTKNPLKPDIISVYNKKLFILDAKYYSININEQSLTGNPGSYDVIKQHIYEMVFDNEMIKEKYKSDIELSYLKTISVLVFPKLMEENFEVFSYTKHPVFNNIKKLIINIYVSPKYIYNLFLNRNLIDNRVYEEIIDYDKERRNFHFELS